MKVPLPSRIELSSILRFHRDDAENELSQKRATETQDDNIHNTIYNVILSSYVASFVVFDF